MYFIRNLILTNLEAGASSLIRLDQRRCGRGFGVVPAELFLLTENTSVYTHVTDVKNDAIFFF